MASWQTYLNIERAPLRVAVARLLASEQPLSVEELRLMVKSVPHKHQVSRYYRHHHYVEGESHVLFVC